MTSFPAIPFPATSTVYTPIMEALLSLLQERCGRIFQTYSRRLVMWEQLAQSLQTGNGTVDGTLIRQPALYLFDGVITADSGQIKYERTGMGVPSKREMMRSIVIYAQIPGGGTAGGIDLTTPGGDVFYPLIEAVESALEPGVEPQGVLTLGGLVFKCWIEGTQFLFPGDIDPYGQGMAVMPVKIMLP